MEEDVKSDVIMLLGLTEPTASQDKIIDFLITDTIEAVRAYCRLEFTPRVLSGLIAQMVVKQYREAAYGSSEQPRDIKSISEGERTISFENRSLSGLLNSYRDRLKPYMNRKGRVPSDIK